MKPKHQPNFIPQHEPKTNNSNNRNNSRGKDLHLEAVKVAREGGVRLALRLAASSKAVTTQEAA